MKKTLFAILLITCCICCKKKRLPENPASVFDKKALLVNLADNVILPNYISFNKTLDSLEQAFETFTISGSQNDYFLVKQQLNNSYLKYQHISPYELGPAENIIVRMNFNVFPTDTNQINANIKSGSYNLSSVSNLDAKGFPALDYLF